MGGLFPEACIRPPRNMGTYVMLQFANAGECLGWIWIVRFSFLITRY